MRAQASWTRPWSFVGVVANRTRSLRKRLCQAWVRSITERRAGCVGAGGGGGVSSPLTGVWTVYPRAAAASRVSANSNPLSRHRCWGRRRVGLGRGTTMPSRVASATFMSWRLAALIAARKGAPRRSRRMWRFVPSLPRLVGSGPVSLPPRGGRHRRAVRRLPLPADALLPVVAAELVRPHALPGPGPAPLLAAATAGRAGPELAGDRLPLAAGAQHVEDAVQHGPERDGGATGGARRLLAGQQRPAFGPKPIGDAPDGRCGSRIVVTGHGGVPPSPSCSRACIPRASIGIGT